MKKLQYYVYIFLDSRKPGKFKYNQYEFNYQPFYVGKGKNDRINAHFCPKALEVNNLKNNTIKKIIKLNLKVIKLKLFENLTEDFSHQIEKELISYIGRKDLKLGPLTNLTDGGEGTSNSPKYSKRKKVQKICILSNIILETYDSIKISANENNLNASCISACCRKKSVSHGGYKWKFENSNEPLLERKNIQKETNQLDKKGNLIEKFSSAKAAATKLNIISSEIVACCRGKKKTAGGYIWEYANAELKNQFNKKHSTKS